MTEEIDSSGLNPLTALILLERAMRDTLIVGAVVTGILLAASGWRNAAMLAAGAAISVASLWEWRRLLRFLHAKLENQKQTGNALLVAGSFVLRLTVFAAAIYGSLKCFRGSVVALLCGLSLALVATAWEALRLLRD